MHTLIMIQTHWDQLIRFLNNPLFKLGDSGISITTIFVLLGSLVLLFFMASRINKLLVNRILSRLNLEYSTRVTIGAFVKYIIIVLGLIIIMQSAGINLSTLNILFGALGVGIGFGLQNITNNFISGIIIMFEKPIKIGDRIVVGGTEGNVESISARATTITTNDNISIIVPNSEFISQRVINWSLRDRKVRFRIPVSVAYGSDVRLVEKLLIEVGKENPDVLEFPIPSVRFIEFGDNGLLFELRAWSSSLSHRKGKLISDLNFGIVEKFEKNKIEIPFPQRDLHLRSGFDKL